MQSFLNRKATDGLAWWTRNDLKGVLSGIYTKATDWGYWTDRNPALRTTLGRKRAKRLKLIFSDEQFGLFLRELRDDLRLMVETAISTGMRVSEIIGLKWRCVDLNRGLIRVQERYYRATPTNPSRNVHIAFCLWECCWRTIGVGSRKQLAPMTTSSTAMASRWMIGNCCGTNCGPQLCGWAFTFLDSAGIRSAGRILR